ncbi:hypothetical protein Tco_0860681 [Tanacetum coccineum]|uniref:Uncharacterized protein n=1 Tax=Tanacetum coccineum TaxID=301880 RepID=A0ABQ5BHC9_9ASTR
MPTPRTFIMSRTGLFILLIILSDFEDDDTTLPVVSAPSSPDRVPASSSYSPDSDSDFEPTKDDSSDKNLSETAKSPQTQSALTPFVQSPSATSPSSPPPSFLPSLSRKRSRSPSPPLPPVSPPLPPLPSSLLSNMLLPCKRVRMTSPETAAATETTMPGLAASACILRVTGETAKETIPLLLARLTRYDGVIDHVCEQLQKMSRERVEAIEDDMETLQAISTYAENRITGFLDARDADLLEIAELRSRA